MKNQLRGKYLIIKIYMIIKNLHLRRRVSGVSVNKYEKIMKTKRYGIKMLSINLVLK